ncbi:MAG: hypothetical protein K2X26_07635 [Chitinophagaceae bacterium]|nr:hypothetical protein [Chitinophagaceae bacterium]
MSIQLFVEKLNEDKSLGYTYNHSMMIENAKRIKVEGIENLNDCIGLVFSAGRYVGLICIDADNKIGMMFIDCKKDKNIASEAANRLFSSINHRHIFMKTFYSVTENYKRNYTLIELVKDNNFTPNIIAN